ncbi:hypothetical protein PCE1_004733 [Barthelona sp. PCE]
MLSIQICMQIFCRNSFIFSKHNIFHFLFIEKFKLMCNNFFFLFKTSFFKNSTMPSRKRKTLARKSASCSIESRKYPGNMKQVLSYFKNDLEDFFQRVLDPSGIPRTSADWLFKQAGKFGKSRSTLKRHSAKGKRSGPTTARVKEHVYKLILDFVECCSEVLQKKKSYRELQQFIFEKAMEIDPYCEFQEVFEAEEKEVYHSCEFQEVSVGEEESPLMRENMSDWDPSSDEDHLTLDLNYSESSSDSDYDAICSCFNWVPMQFVHPFSFGLY